MIKVPFFASAKSASTIEVVASKQASPSALKVFRFYADEKPVLTLKPISVSESNSSFIYTFFYEDFHFIPGHSYHIVTESNFFIPIDISFLSQSEEFEKQYRYDGELGAIYTKEKTTFRVFAPFATNVTLKLKRKGNENLESYVMNHDFSDGIFEITLEGDFDEARYVYVVTLFGLGYTCFDPYSFSLDANARHSFVIDPEKVRAIPLHEEALPPFRHRDEAIIYECDVRDMTSLTSLKNKGTYAALSKEGLKSEEGMPIGLDYLSSLGVTHIQLQPVLDFQTIDEDDPSSSYNWGYDPLSYMAPEGSYALDPNSAYSRVNELRTLVSKLHQHGMRVTFDVVYNHMFSDYFNPLYILCPGYYFRKNADGSNSNGTGCGNDFESTHYMARKLILDSLLHLMDFYGADGFRFDLMGILDIDTVKQGYELCSKKKPELLYYGEGWDLWTALPGDKKASYYNADKMPYAAFFNDRFRDVVKGKSNDNEFSVPGYLLGDSAYRDGFKHVYLGSSVPLSFAPLFKSPLQSINYVECHDNHTLYDKIKAACPEASEAEMEKIIKLNIIATLMSCGIPYFHAGEEIGASKKGIGNSYNSGDEINGFDYSLLAKKQDLFHYFQDAIAFKKKFIELAGDEYEDLIHHVTFEDLPDGALKITYDLKKANIYVVFNPSKMSFMIDFDDYASLVFNETGFFRNSPFYIHLGIINALSCNIFIEKKEDQSYKTAPRKE